MNKAIREASFQRLYDRRMTDSWQIKRVVLLERFEKATDLPLLVLALAMIPIVALPEMADLSKRTSDELDLASWLIWGVFAFEYVVRLTLVEKKWAFVKREWPDLLIILLPFLRPLRIVRSVHALRMLRLVRLTVILS